MAWIKTLVAFLTRGLGKFIEASVLGFPIYQMEVTVISSSPRCWQQQVRSRTLPARAASVLFWGQLQDLCPHLPVPLTSSSLAWKRARLL